MVIALVIVLVVPLGSARDPEEPDGWAQDTRALGCWAHIRSDSGA